MITVNFFSSLMQQLLTILIIVISIVLLILKLLNIVLLRIIICWLPFSRQNDSQLCFVFFAATLHFPFTPPVFSTLTFKNPRGLLSRHVLTPGAVETSPWLGPHGSHGAAGKGMTGIHKTLLGPLGSIYRWRQTPAMRLRR